MATKKTSSKNSSPDGGRPGRLRTIGDPVLRERARPVTEFDTKLRKLAHDMMDVMESEEGVGLAAPQVGVLSRVIVWKHPESDDERYYFVNPEIVERSEACCTLLEGCLSVPGESMEVSRAEEVVVTAQDLEGRALRMHVTGLLARIVQHEIDHLDGCLIVDRTSPEERRRVMKALRERILTADT
jgi:peptide deformylase